MAAIYRTVFQKYFKKYFGKFVPTKNEATMSSAHKPGYSPDRFGQAVRRKYEAVTSSRSSPDQFSAIPGFFGKAIREIARKCDEQVSRLRFIE